MKYQQYEKYTRTIINALEKYETMGIQSREYKNARAEKERIDRDTGGLLSQGWMLVPQPDPEPKLSDVPKPGILDTELRQSFRFWLPFTIAGTAAMMMLAGVPFIAAIVIAAIVSFMACLPILSRLEKKKARKAYKKMVSDYEKRGNHPLWQTLDDRIHGKAIPEGDHSKFAVHVKIDGDSEQLQLLEYKKFKDYLLAQVLVKEDVMQDASLAASQALSMASIAEDKELAAWQEQYGDVADEAIAKEIEQQNIEERRRALGMALGQTLTSEDKN